MVRSAIVTASKRSLWWALT